MSERDLRLRLAHILTFATDCVPAHATECADALIKAGVRLPDDTPVDRITGRVATVWTPPEDRVTRDQWHAIMTVANLPGYGSILKGGE